MKKLSRKDFMRISLTSSLSLPWIGLTSCKSGSGRKDNQEMPSEGDKLVDNIGLQVFAIRDKLKENAEAVFKELSEIGIKNIELFDPATLTDYVPIIRNYGMNSYCCHFLPGYISGKWETARQIGMAPPDRYNFENMLEDCNNAGIKYLGIAIMMPEERETMDDYRKFADQTNIAGEKSKSAGIQLYYHNHSFEFKPAGNTTPMQEMLNIFDPELVKIELDPFWVTISGNDPVEWMDKLNGRLLFLHLKDLRKDTPLDYTVFEVSQNAFVELGDGILDLRTILTQANDMGINHVFIDQDHSQMDMMQSIRRNYYFLKGLNV